MLELVYGKFDPELVELALEPGNLAAVAFLGDEVVHFVRIFPYVVELGIVSIGSAVEMDELETLVGDTVMFQDVVLRRQVVVVVIHVFPPLAWLLSVFLDDRQK